jgi:hypothetical protein
MGVSAAHSYRWQLGKSPPGQLDSNNIRGLREFHPDERAASARKLKLPKGNRPESLSGQFLQIDDVRAVSACP